MVKVHTSNIREGIQKILNEADEKANTNAKVSKVIEVYLSGKVYTARDAAHKKIIELLNQNKPMPFDIKDSTVYYAGPTPPPEINPLSLVVGAIGPTTSKRMDIYTEPLLKRGLACMIGKGGRSEAVYEAMQLHGAMYLSAIGGAGAIYAKCVKSVKVIAFEELGCESVKELEIEDFPVYYVR